jgi:hypothetical protein
MCVTSIGIEILLSEFRIQEARDGWLVGYYGQLDKALNTYVCVFTMCVLKQHVG